MACEVSENTPEITAWLAMMVAQVASPISGQSAHSGAR